MNSEASKQNVQRRLVPCALLAILAGFAWHALRWSGWIVDDAFIYYRFAANFADGNGLVFNPGERVEGHSSTVWVLLLAALKKLGVSIPTAARMSGLVLSLGTIYLSWRLALRLASTRAAALIAPALLALSMPFALWSVAGMPMALLVFLLLLSTLVYQREWDAPDRVPWSGLLIGLLALARPESPAYALIFLGHSAIVALATGSVASHRRQLLLRLAMTGTVVALFLAWRLSYYGHLFSNATYAKIGNAGGLFSEYAIGQYRLGLIDYILPFVRLHWPLLLTAGLTFPFIWRPRLRSPALLALFVIAFQLVLTLKSGGDWMPVWRLVQPAAPFLAALTAAGISAVAVRARVRFGPRRRLTLLLSLIPLIGASWTFAQLEVRSAPRIRLLTGVWSSVLDTGEAMGEIIPAGDTVAACAMGALPWALYDNRFVDMVGLCDEHIAHHGKRALPQLGLEDQNWERADPDYVFYERKPEWVFIVRMLEHFPGQRHLDGPGAGDRKRDPETGFVWTVDGTSASNQVAALHPALAADYALVKEFQNGPVPDTAIVQQVQSGADLTAEIRRSGAFAEAAASRRGFLYRRQ